ncbi:DHS-like NAD/FAD-binding domain-containing protein [Roridomyces roridus]|uniref:DHS-like NAD/FAD-binding domain-containing protein n=1 Tax=Roridomyces roridus TaxID=1738132 RepID=A0AAD7CJT9_9AGAR|nr:DHS-like NAD/FAD-binding domain-containing protein [Roridomyces roridus]
MTLFLPLEPSSPVPASPSFLQVPSDHTVQLDKVLKAILKAKRIVVVCGAGISVKAGIPDFRSPEGLFQTLKRDNPKEVLASGKDLFDASVFHSENTTSLFCQMIARLSELSMAAEPTAFHNLLHTLDTRGRLLRVYTQNIDAIEQKSGLSFGVPPFEERRSKPRTPKPAGTDAEPGENIASTSRLPTPPAETPRCIPLHGTLQTVHCQICNHSYALADYHTSLLDGTPPECPECSAMEATRQLVGKRARGIGRLRPSVVLYNEAHKDGEGVGDVVRRDLMGQSKGKGRSGADLLLVVGTSLRVPGTKRMVREFAKAVRSRGKDGGSNRASPMPAVEEEQPVKTVYLNLDFPVPTREWEGVFDAWLQGDAQVFADMLQVEIDRETRAKEIASEKKRRKEEEDAGERGKKRKPASAPQSTGSPKRRKIANLPLTPPRSKPSSAPPTKLFLTIPSLRARKLIPEVYISSTRPPRSPPKLPPTPEKSPPRPTRRSARTKSKSERLLPALHDDNLRALRADEDLLPSLVRELHCGGS